MLQHTGKSFWHPNLHFYSIFEQRLYKAILLSLARKRSSNDFSSKYFMAIAAISTVQQAKVNLLFKSFMQTSTKAREGPVIIEAEAGLLELHTIITVWEHKISSQRYQTYFQRQIPAIFLWAVSIPCNVQIHTLPKITELVTLSHYFKLWKRFFPFLYKYRQRHVMHTNGTTTCKTHSHGLFIHKSQGTWISIQYQYLFE